MEDNTDIVEFTDFPTNTVELRKEDFYPIWDKCSLISNVNLRCRMVANLITATAAQKLLSQLNIYANNSSSLQEVLSILTHWDISELYVNGCKISVRYAFNDYEYFVSKKQERYGIFGDLFMFVRISEDLSVAKLEGFLPVKNINRANSDNENYYFHKSEFKQFESIKKYFDIKKEPEDVETLKKERLKIVQYIEGTLSDKVEFFKLLSRSEFLRSEMIKFENCERLLSLTSEKEEVIKQEIENDLANISQLADAFIQARETVIATSNSESFKIECARANLEKLFNSTKEPDIETTIKNQSTEEVMDTLLTNSPTLITNDSLPRSAVLKAFRFFGVFILTFLIISGLYCFINYVKFVHTNNFDKVKSEITQIIEMIK